MELSWIIKFIVLAGATLVLYNFVRKPGRSAEDVLQDLQELYPHTGNELSSTLNCPSNQTVEVNLLKGLKAEIISKGETVDLTDMRWPIIIGALIGVLTAIVLGVTKLPALLLSFIGGAAAVYLTGGIRQRAQQTQLIQEIEQLLPVVMERLVMAVQSGLDIVAALNTVVKLDQQESQMDNEQDPLSELLGVVTNLSESGLSFASALNQVAEAIPCVALRHAFVHLGLAYQEGGELVTPLRELSDATQLYYQESIEERIARLPVKATMPLILTFAGLVICFITAPLLQVLDVITTVTIK